MPWDANRTQDNRLPLPEDRRSENLSLSGPFEDRFREKCAVGTIALFIVGSEALPFFIFDDGSTKPFSEVDRK